MTLEAAEGFTDGLAVIQSASCFYGQSRLSAYKGGSYAWTLYGRPGTFLRRKKTPSCLIVGVPPPRGHKERLCFWVPICPAHGGPSPQRTHDFAKSLNAGPSPALCTCQDKHDVSHFLPQFFCFFKQLDGLPSRHPVGEQDLDLLSR